MDILEDHVHTIEKYLQSGFETKLFSAVLGNLKDDSNILRINNFSYGARELISIVLERLAPDEKVTLCSWFVPDPNTTNGRATRKQKVKYSIIGELCVDYVSNNFDIDITTVEQCIADEYTNLSKYTHLRNDTFPIMDNENIIALEALSSLSKFFSSVHEARELVDTHLYSELNKNIFHEISEHHMDIFLHLAWITRLDDIWIDDIELSMDHESVYCDVSGSASVDLECSKEVGETEEDCYIGSVSCPFTVQAVCPVTDLRTFDFGDFEIETPY